MTGAALKPLVAGLLAAAVAFFSWQLYGGRGLLFALSALAFLALLQFNRTVRVMRVAARNPLAHVASAVMFQATLRPGLTMLEVVSTTRTLGRKVEGSADEWLWTDDGGDSVRLRFERGRLASWQLERVARRS